MGKLQADRCPVRQPFPHDCQWPRVRIEPGLFVSTELMKGGQSREVTRPTFIFPPPTFTPARNNTIPKAFTIRLRA